MFFRRRSTQAECLDLPRPEAEFVRYFRDLDRLNRFFAFSRLFRDNLPCWIGPERCTRLNILDVGAGTGLLSRQLSTWSQQRGWEWQFTNLDANPVGLRTGPARRAVVASAMDLPFADGSFDLVLTSQMTHHLGNAEAIQHLREAWRVTRDAFMLSDLHRNVGLYAMLLFLPPLLGISGEVRQDALLSVKRGFRLRELCILAQNAGLRSHRVWLYYGTRVILQARKQS